MTPFNVIWEDNGKFTSYDIMPYLSDKYDSLDVLPSNREEVKKFIERFSMYMWWSRCQYEILISDWPSQRNIEKWDIHKQVMMNIEVITDHFIKEKNIKFKNNG